MKVFSFTVEGKPQGKGRPRTAVRGRFATHYTPPKTVAYEKLIAQSARLVFKGEPHEGSVSLKVECFMPWPAATSKAKRETMPYAPVKPDLDNIIKAICDGLNGVVWKDDAQVVRLSSTKKRAIEGRVIVTVGLMTDQEGLGVHG